MNSEDDEKSDEWVESYDSMDDSDDESTVAEPTFPLKLKQKPKSKKRVAIAATNSEESSAESDPINSDASGDEAPVDVDCQNDKLKSNPAWANAMSKVLRSKKKVSKKAIVLSKAKKVVDVKEKKPKLDFEVVNADNADEEADDVKEEKANLKKKFLMKEQLSKGRVKPSVLDRDRERTLMKIATRGVVQLFNAVRQQQKAVDKTVKKAGKSELKREKVLESIDKKKFLDVLTGSAKIIPAGQNIKLEEKNDENNGWSVLRDDFMMGTKLKDWDKKEDTI